MTPDDEARFITLWQQGLEAQKSYEFIIHSAH